MRTIKSVVFFLLIILAACSPKGEMAEIRDISTGYLKALVEYRLDDAKHLGDSATVHFLETQQEIIAGWTPEKQEQARKRFENIEVAIASVEIDGHSATVKYELVQDAAVLQSERLYLVKTSGGWRVHESL